MFMTNTVIVCDTKGQNIFVQCIKQREACKHPLIRRIRTGAIIRSAGLYDRAQTKLTARNLKQSTARDSILSHGMTSDILNEVKHNSVYTRKRGSFD